jgi:hypothetical protein
MHAVRACAACRKSALPCERGNFGTTQITAAVSQTAVPWRRTALSICRGDLLNMLSQRTGALDLYSFNLRFPIRLLTATKDAGCLGSCAFTPVFAGILTLTPYRPSEETFKQSSGSRQIYANSLPQTRSRPAGRIVRRALAPRHTSTGRGSSGIQELHNRRY